MHACPLLLALAVLLTLCQPGGAQTSAPKFGILGTCSYNQREYCKTSCETRYKDPDWYLCPCYSKMNECLTVAGCNFRQRMEVTQFCTRAGYCKDYTCKYRPGDVTPKAYSVQSMADFMKDAVGSSCVGSCAPETSEQRADQRKESGDLRRSELEGYHPQPDYRLGVNQWWYGMPYSLPVPLVANDEVSSDAIVADTSVAPVGSMSSINSGPTVPPDVTLLL